MGREGLIPFARALLSSFLLGTPVDCLERLRLGRIPSLLLCSAKIDESLNQLDSLRENCMVRSVSGELSMLVIEVQIVVF